MNDDVSIMASSPDQISIMETQLKEGSKFSLSVRDLMNNAEVEFRSDFEDCVMIDLPDKILIYSTEEEAGKIVDKGSENDKI